MKPSVVNIRSYLGQSDDKVSCVYVGRANQRYRLRGHRLANPFALRSGAGSDQREECLEKYRKWLLALTDLDVQLRLLYRQCEGGKLPLACWCHPLSCHCDILAELLGQVSDLSVEAAQ